MKLSLSTRIAEASDRKDRAAMDIAELAPMVAAAGFEAVSMRASVVSVESSPERVSQVRAVLDRAGLGVSMVMGDVAMAANSTQAPAALRRITPYLDLAETLGARLIRVMMHSVEDIAPAQRAADEAAERGITLSHQTHWGTLCETMAGTLKTVRAVGRGNFGVTLEPANLLACGETDWHTAIPALAPHLVNVYFQNVRMDPAGAHTFRTHARGPVPLDYVALDDPSGLNPRELAEGLRAVGYDGWLTVHQPLRAGQSVGDAVDEAAQVFRPLA